MDQLKQCPFCGQQPAADVYNERHYIACLTDDCDANPSVSGDTFDEAAGRWNKRAVCGKKNNGIPCTMPAGSKCPDCGPSIIDYHGE